MVNSRTERVACAVLCVASSAAVLLQAWPNRDPGKTDGTEITTAYLDGRLVSFQLAPVPPGGKVRKVGPWQFGPQVSFPTPRDRRLNLYVVVPGSEHRLPGYQAYDHNDIINHMPAGGGPVEWDVYWALVLDPSLGGEFRSEDEILLATQKEFHPGADFQFEDMPSAEFLRDIVKITSFEALEKYRRPSGNLPQVLILPADFAVRASAHELQEPDAGDH
jgi:hypothetical protein